jgi:hypothetical protein
MSWEDLLKRDESTKWILGAYQNVSELVKRLENVDIEEEFVNREKKWASREGTGRGQKWLEDFSQVLFDFDEALSEVLK